MTGGMFGRRHVSAPMISRSFPAHPSVLYQIRQFIRQLAGEDMVPSDMADDLVLAASEACANCLRHTVTSQIRLDWSSSNEHVEISVRDEGVFGRRIPIPELEIEGGHGIPLMMALMDEVQISKGTARRPGTLVRLIKYRDR